MDSEVNTAFKQSNDSVKEKTNTSSNSLVNQATRKMEFDRGIPLSFDFVKNEIHTIKHGFLIQLWYILFNLFKRPLQLLLVLLNIIYLIAYLILDFEISSMNIYFVFIVQLSLLFIETLYELVNYLKIIINDHKTNSQIAYVYDLDNKSFMNTTWRDIRVGHIIKINRDEIVPADIIILETLDSNHTCYVDDSSITGVFDSFKVKKSCIDTQTPVMKPIRINEYIKNIRGMLKYEEPNEDLTFFNGRLKLESFPRASDITIENFIMRGSSVKNIKCVYGLVVFTGMETKIMQIIQSEKGSDILKKKRDLIGFTLIEVQYLIIVIYFIFVLNYAIASLSKTYQFDSNLNNFKYLGLVDPWKDYFISLIQFAFSIQLFIPYIWFNLIYIAYYILGKLLIWDAKVRKKARYNIDLINTDCLSDFGQVKYILSDKTGTLTKRKFNIKSCIIGKKFYRLDTVTKGDENYVFRQMNEDVFKNLDIYNDLEKDKRDTHKAGKVKQFLEYLCICNYIKLRNYANQGSMVCASFAEEKAILKILDSMDFKIQKTKNDKIILDICKETKIYYVVGRNRYSEERRRMSIIVKMRKTENESILLCKGSDITMLYNMSLKEAEIQHLLDQIKRMANLGYRYYIIGKRYLLEDDTNTFVTKYKSAENNMIQREVIFEDLANEYECDMDFLGVIFLEEEFPDELRLSLNKLDSAGIKTWIVSGDRKDNVISIAKNLEMVSPSNTIVEFSKEDNLVDLDIKMNLHLMQFIGADKEKEGSFLSSTELGMKEQFESSLTATFRNNKIEAHKKQQKELFMFVDGDCFKLICDDTRLLQSFTVLLAFTKGFFGYCFSPSNKSKLTKIMQQYVTYNSKLLSIGDGLNDLLMLKEADLSVGIRSREILQVRNTCDIIVNEFTQITDLILVHGTWNLHRLYLICYFSLYSCTLVIFPYYIEVSTIDFGFVFSEMSYLILMLQILLLNISLIFIICLDQNIERPIIGIFPCVYSLNYNTRHDRLNSFIKMLVRAIVDSVIIYYGITYSFENQISSLGQTPDKLIINMTILFASFLLIYFKLLFLYMHMLNALIICLAIISYVGLICLNFIYIEEFIIVKEVFPYLNLMLSFVIVVFFCYFLDHAVYIFYYLNDSDLISKLRRSFKLKLNSKVNITLTIYLDYSIFSNLSESVESFKRIFDSTKHPKEKATFATVAEKLHQTYKSLDSVIENNYNMDNHRISSLKLTKFLKFNDRKLENDYAPYFSPEIERVFLIYILANFLFWLYVLIYQIVIKAMPICLLSIISNAAWILVGFFSCLPTFKEKVKNFFLIYYTIGLALQIISIYIESEFNDIKIGIQFILNVSFAFFFCLKHIKFIIMITLIYAGFLIPSIFLSSTYLVNVNLFDQKFNISSVPIMLDPNFLTKNIGLYVTVFVLIMATLAIMFVYGYNQEKYSRINFLKINTKKLNFKKDQEIFDNLVPKFVQDKMEKAKDSKGDGNSGAIEEERVTILFADICEFDGLVTKMTPKEFIMLLDKIYSTFDQLCSIHGLQKIETVGKTYMASGGLKECEKGLDPIILSKHHTIRTFELALDMIDLISKLRLDNGDNIKMKIGVHSNEVNAAVVGNHKPQFSLIGDTVNTTARMCVNSKENCILITEEAYSVISQAYTEFEYKQLDVKGKGVMKTYLYSPLKHKMEKTENTMAKNFLSNFLKNSIKRSRENGTLAGLVDVLGEGPERKNSFKSNNSAFIVDEFGGFAEKKIINTKKYGIADPTIKQKSQENHLFKHSFLLHFFDDTKQIVIFNSKADKPSTLFKNYSIHKFKSNQSLQQIINYTYCLSIVIVNYYLCYYDQFTYNAPVVGIKLLLGLFLYSITNKIAQDSHEKNSFMEFSCWYVYLSFMILLQFQILKYNEEMIIFFVVEQNLTVVASFFNGVVPHFGITLLLIAYIICFSITIAIGSASLLLDRYVGLSIIIACSLYAFYIYREYLSTIEFIENLQHSEELKAREKLLFNLMPPHVVKHLKEDIPVVDEIYDVTMLYTDIVSFTDFSKAQSTPKNVVRMLVKLFERFDDAVLKNDVYKVHTIGDCYVVLGYTGKVPANERDPQDEAMKVINLGKEMISIIKEVAATKEVNFPSLNMRIGIHTVSFIFYKKNQGTLIAGIIGTKIVRYDVFGIDNAVANKMESKGVPGKVNISEDTRRMIESDDNDLPFTLEFNKIVTVSGASREYKSYLVNFEE